ncbi:MAG: TRAP transporter substrate-binding protein [Clostridiales bacterium]|jgi:tripartite ATP-independent transporter DctP family solute receptor|nr:TRAP transporter substrate-binding protein [Clostridiales bacterium]
MKKALTILGVLILSLVLATQAFAAGDVANDPQIILKIGISTNDQDPRAIAAMEFLAAIEEKSGGSLKGQLYPSGQLGGDAALIESLSLDAGMVDIIITDASNFATYVPQMGISALPFQFDGFDTAWAFMDSEIVAKVEESLIEHNMRVLAHYCNGFRCVTTGSKVINSPEDMKNMLIRTPENPVIMATMRAMGANPQPLAFSELYMALLQGTYDAQENPIPVIYNNKLYEVQKNLSITNHIYSGMCFTIGESVWQKMTEAQRAIVAEAALASQASNRNLNRTMTEDMLEKLEVECGMAIVQPDLEPFKAATASVKDSLAADYGAELMAQVDEWLSNNG